VFVPVFDIVHVAAVWLFTGSTNTDEDYQAYVDNIEALKPKMKGREHPAAILVADPGNPVPNASWRRKIAAASSSFEATPLFALVSSSPVVRGIATAINWIRPPPYEAAVFAHFDEAVAWIESKRGQKQPVFDRLLAEARAIARDRYTASKNVR
jgi:hypothetical protein